MRMFRLPLAAIVAVLLLHAAPACAQSAPDGFWGGTEAEALDEWLSGEQPGIAARPVDNLLAVGYGEARLAAPRGPALGLESGAELGRGEASWYGPGFHGRLTANGERFDQEEMTAAHKTLPFGTRVLVRVPRTGREVVVRINDRGPYAKGRIIDLSSAAANAIGLKARGHDAVVLHELPPAPPGNLDFGFGSGAAQGGEPGLRAKGFE